MREGSPAAPGGGRKHLLGVESSLLGLLVEQGGIPLVLASPPASGGDVLRRLARQQIAGIDALLLQGGADVAPESYGARPLRPEWCGDARRDQYERALLEATLAADKPVLGICRGCQLLNVAFGGSLFQDLDEQRPGSIRHTLPQRYDEHDHALRLASDGLLADLHGRATTRVTSAHHQGIDRLGDGLDVEAWCAEDNLVEAVRARSGWVVGVQWHPEFHPGRPSLLPAQPLLRSFLAAAAMAREPA
jgi:putative glutamine amidotransferase